MFLDEFPAYLSPEPLLITGDFNIRVNVPNNSEAARFLELLTSMSLEQRVDKPTHISGHTLDLIITRCSDSLLFAKPMTDYLFSDHITVLCELELGKPPPKVKQMNIGKYFHITPALYELHWLPVSARIHFKILLLAFKAIHGIAPAYISNLLVIKRKSSYNLRSNSGILLEPPRGKMLGTLGERAFQAAAPHLWNELPLQLRNIGSVEIFKNSIKTFLFRQFFNSG